MHEPPHRRVRPQQRHPRGTLQEAVEQPRRQRGDEAPPPPGRGVVFRGNLAAAAAGVARARDVAREGASVIDQEGDSWSSFKRGRDGEEGDGDEGRPRQGKERKGKEKNLPFSIFLPITSPVRVCGVYRKLVAGSMPPSSSSSHASAASAAVSGVGVVKVFVAAEGVAEEGCRLLFAALSSSPSAAAAATCLLPPFPALRLAAGVAEAQKVSSPSSNRPSESRVKKKKQCFLLSVFFFSFASVSALRTTTRLSHLPELSTSLSHLPSQP